LVSELVKPIFRVSLELGLNKAWNFTFMPNSIVKLGNKVQACSLFPLPPGSIEMDLIDFILDVMFFAVVLAII